VKKTVDTDVEKDGTRMIASPSAVPQRYGGVVVLAVASLPYPVAAERLALAVADSVAICETLERPS